MKNFLKKYWAHILNIELIIFLLSFFVYASIMTDLEPYSTPNNSIIILYIIGIIINLIGIWIEIIYHIVHAAKHREIKNHILCAIYNYIFYLFYTPCYRLKYIYKDKNYKIKNAFYLIFSIVSFIIVCLVSIIVSAKTSTYTYKSTDKKISIELPYQYDQYETDKFDLYFESDYSVIGVKLYNESGQDANENILSSRIDSTLYPVNDIKFIDDTSNNDISKTISTKTFEGEYKNSELIFCFSIITFDYNSNYQVYVIQTTPKENYEKLKEEFQMILKSIYLNK